MMASLLPIAALSVLPASPVGDYLPGVGDFRAQEIKKVQSEKDWPFTADGGLLMCAYVLKEPTVYFVPDHPEGETSRPYHISYDMAAMAFVNIGQTDVLRPYDSLEQLLDRMTPYVALGRRLCEQPAGTMIPDTEL